MQSKATTDTMENSAEDLSPRPYQSRVLDIALHQNTIVFLPTGSGKTFIAVMLIKRLAAEVQEKYSDGGKRTFFLVNTVALAEQQKNYILRHSCLTVGHYTGDMNVDFWKEEKWREELDKHQVLVMTAQILLDILNHNYLHLSSINLIVFDECHHAVNQHCMSKIMKHFDHCYAEEQPRVLGLTATLLNSSTKYHRVIETVSGLEDTFRSKIATIQNVNEVESFSTSPIEKHIQFDKVLNYDVVSKVKVHLFELIDFLQNYAFTEDKTQAPEIEGAILQKKQSTGKKLSNKLLDVFHHIETLGLYGGAISALKLIMLIERLRNKAEMSDTMMIYGAIITTLSMVRTMLDLEMREYSENIRIHKFSSPQVLTLLEVLKQYSPGDGRGIIFVKRRLTAKVLFHILRNASENIEELNFIRADFVVGFNNNPLSYTREGQLEKKWNRHAMDKFRKGETNIIVASDVLEEGIDIPLCKLVVKFDVPVSYRSYIQSKGRARHKNSFFVVFVPKEDSIKVANELNEYQNIESVLKDILSGKQQASPGEIDVTDSGQEEDIIYWAADGASVSYNSAIPLVNRYCSKLPQDAYTKLVPYWFLKGSATKGPYQCILQLPVNSLLKECFMGKVMQNKKRAKQSAAFASCVALHKAGELNDHLLPVGHKYDDMIDEEKIFSVYHKASEKEDMQNPGTKKCRRLYKKQVSKSMCGYAPTEGKTLYLHVLCMTPDYEMPSEENTRRHAFYQLLVSENCFAILSSKRFPRICDFPVFLNVGKIAVSVVVNSSEVQLTEEQIMKLRQFNTMLFFDLLKLHKSYLMIETNTEGINYFVVPVKSCGGPLSSRKNVIDYEIDWTVIKNNCRIPTFIQPTEAKRLGNEDCDWMKFQHSLVVPWYRGLPPDQVYVVTEVCQDKSPLSAFPTSSTIEYATYEDYFNRKYSLTINNSSQPLFEVKAITNHLNCLKPRTGHGSGRSKRQEANDDFEEHLVPELCISVNFPSTLWLKAVCIPSCLHRISQILLAEELLQEIAKDLQFLVPKGKQWENLAIDPVCINEESDRSKHTSNHSTIKVNANTTNIWDGDGEPVDIDREKLEDVTLWDLLYYDEFINKPAVEIDDSSSSFEDDVVSHLSLLELCDVIVPEISLLKRNNGLELSKIVQALTCACSNDALNLERLETLGDSYLKFASSLFLFLKYPKLDEGKLTQAKGKIVGNRNLFYCGRNRDIIGKMKVHEFNPKCDWVPPTYCVPNEIIQNLLDYDLCPSILFEIIFTREEQESGILSPDSVDHWQEVINSADRKYTPSPTESLMGVQSVPDKNVADCVEALIGAYLQGFGIKGALKLVNWFGILPPSLADPDDLLESPPCSPFISEEGDVMTKMNLLLNEFDVKELEERLNYKFKNRGFLLQALSHASNCRNRLTDCYQRLEFLGDAILDFLVTCHIYEHCGGLSPGDLTDLRSALVNNITFGSLAVRYGFHQFCYYDSPKLFEKIDSFVNFQEKHGHKINEEVLLLYDENVADPVIGESVDVPKVLGDLFESLAGAIYLDSGKSLTTVWNVYYRLMKYEIETFSQNIPKQPVRILYESCNPPPVFSPTQLMNEMKKVIVELEVFHKDEKKRFYGVGENRAEAKRTAAKIALKYLR